MVGARSATSLPAVSGLMAKMRYKSQSITALKRPSVVGHYTNDFVYDRVGPKILSELRRRNPVLPQGWRKNRHHQWFTPEFGHPKLLQHIEGVTALMRAAPSWESFKRALDRAYPKIGDTIPLGIEEDSNELP